MDASVILPIDWGPGFSGTRPIAEVVRRGVDGVNVDFDVYRIRTQITAGGSRVAAPRPSRSPAYGRRRPRCCEVSP